MTLDKPVNRYFLDTTVNIEGNSKLRAPQIEAYIKIKNYFEDNSEGEALVVLPTGTGKSGLISIAPFGVSEGRVLIITPGLITKDSIRKTQEVIHDNFWQNYQIIFSAKDIPIVNEYTSEIRQEYLESSNIVYSNIQKLGASRKGGLINRVGQDFFDLIIIDESHHAPADSWKEILEYFDAAKVLHVTGTPYRGDGQPLPGKLIHETKLSEVMRDKHVKWLRKHSIDSKEIYFTMPESPGKKFTVEEVLQFKDQDWLEKSIALSPECSVDVIDYSIKNLEELREISPSIPHKILAVGCSILHAEDLERCYRSKGLRTVLVHSGIHADDLEREFRRIDDHDCDVIISVDMLKEGYDHQYLNTLALFRPYRSLNAFAQIVGRVLRIIPEEKIRSFEIDNNALVIYHKGIGLDDMWGYFEKEVDRAQHGRANLNFNDNVDISDSDYERRKTIYGEVSTEDSFVSEQSSYLPGVDFNEIYEKKRREIIEAVDKDIEGAVAGSGVSEDELAKIKALLVAERTEQAVSEFIDPLVLQKRPGLAQEQLRTSLTGRTSDVALDILLDKGIDPKGNDFAVFLIDRGIVKLFQKQRRDEVTNEAAIIIYINAKLYAKFGVKGKRNNKELIKSLEELPNYINEIKDFINDFL